MNFRSSDLRVGTQSPERGHAVPLPSPRRVSCYSASFMVVGILFGLGASASWAVANVVIQRCSRRLGAVRAALWAQVIGGIGAALIALLEHPAARWSTSTTVWAAAGGLAALVAYVGLFTATEGGRLSIVIPIISSWSVLAAAIGIGVLGEHLRAVQFLGAALVVAGVWLVAQTRENATTGGERPALGAALAGALGFGVLIPAIGQLAPAAGALGSVAVVMAVELLVAVPLGLALGFDLGPPRGEEWRSALAAGLFEVLGFACVALATARAPVAVVSPAASIGGAVTVAWAWLVLRERPGAVALAGAALSAAGVVTLSL